MKKSSRTSESQSNEAPGTEHDGAKDIVSAVMGPICETLGVNILRSVTKALDRIISSGTERLVVGWEIGRRDKLAQQKAREIILKRLAGAAAEKAIDTPPIVASSLSRWADDVIREQANTLDILALAKEQLTLNPPEDDSEREIDDTWLNHFYDLAKHKSSPVAQAMFAKLIVEEIKNPGSFSIKTLRILAEMPEKTGKAFKRLCNLSFLQREQACIICAPYGHPGRNSMSEFGLSFIDLTYLMDSDLIIGNLDTSCKLEAFKGALIYYANKLCVLSEDGGYDSEVGYDEDVQVIIFSVVGFELRKIMILEENENYTRRLFDWYRSKGLILNRVTHHYGDQVRGMPLF